MFTTQNSLSPEIQRVAQYVLGLTGQTETRIRGRGGVFHIEGQGIGIVQNMNELRRSQSKVCCYT